MIKKILISQPQPSIEKNPYRDMATKHSVEIVFRSFIKVERLNAQEFRQQKVSILNHSAIVFNSRHAVDHFFALCKELRIALPEKMKYFGVSEAVALYTQHYIPFRKRKVFFGQSGQVADLVALMGKHKEEKYLLPQSDVHTSEFSDRLDTKKLKYTDCVMYRTVSNDFEKGEPFDYDMLVFFTPSGIHSLKKNFPDFQQGDIHIVCWGDDTQKAAEEAGLQVNMKAPNEVHKSIVAAISAYLDEKKQSSTEK